ncbi:MAG: cold shock domain-containing protein [Acidobacteria bacterium]|nr:cold shock domain-containing protein [Acidobacteriota bacterium]MCL5287936.1 cold shock domain-containing protein [Acidobacteriota bacterium]
MEGVVWGLYRDKQGGLIRGNDGLEIPFDRAALSNVDFQALFAGQRVCYRVRSTWWGPEAVEVQPMELRSQPYKY